MFKLFFSPEGVLIRSHKDTWASIDNNGVVSAISSRPDNFRYDRAVEAYGVIGVFNLLNGPYIAFVTEAKMAARIRGSNIMNITGTEIVFIGTTRNITHAQASNESYCLSLLRQQLNHAGLYFSMTKNATEPFDITHSVQWNVLQKKEATQIFAPKYSLVDQRFFWNFAAQSIFSASEFDHFVFPIICGFVRSEVCAINSQSFEFCLISRRSRHRAGTRYNVRGIDSRGNVANFVETEQIFETVDSIGSFLQIRGSIPLYWSQMANIRYKPTPTIDESRNSESAFKTHFNDINSRYGHITMVSLIDLKGSELVLAKEFKNIASTAASTELHFVEFDFHAKCKKNKYENLSELLDVVQDDLRRNGCFLESSSHTSKQSGVVRTNCIDCLDRTNVVQGLLALVMLQQSFEKIGILNGPTDDVKAHEAFYSVFRNMWADNADYISTQYAGTGALKTDFTRTGKRSHRGMIQDGYNSVMRYYLNNFRDGQRQDSYDLILGVSNINTATQAFIPVSFAKMLFACIAINIVLLAGALAPPSTSAGKFCLFSLAQGIAWYVVFRIAVLFGPSLVDIPRLRSDMTGKSV